jgi:DNA-binding transcriptional LysR family regulator
MIGMVSIKQGIATLPQSSKRKIDYTGKQIKVLRPTNPQINWHLRIAWRKESYISTATKTWIDFVKDRLK